MTKLKKTIVLVGMMGAGKTAVGTALARRLGVRFLDSDTEIERAAAMTVAEIFERDGELFFREKEAQVLARLLEDSAHVLAIGGGAFVSADNRRMIAERGVSVWLRASADLLWHRVKSKPTRPLLQTPRPRQTLEELMRVRTPVYALADLVVDAKPGISAAHMAGRVEDALVSHPELFERSA